MSPRNVSLIEPGREPTSDERRPLLGLAELTLAVLLRRPPEDHQPPRSESATRWPRPRSKGARSERRWPWRPSGGSPERQLQILRIDLARPLPSSSHDHHTGLALTLSGKPQWGCGGLLSPWLYCCLFGRCTLWHCLFPPAPPEKRRMFMGGEEMERGV